MVDSQRYVLLVDDEADFLETISFWLKAKGYNVRVANSGEEALGMIAAEEPYLVFLDLNMPEMNGVQLLTEIRKTKKSLPVIMVSAYCDDPRMADASKLGISGIFPKHGTFNELGDVLEVSLRMHKQRAQNNQ